MFNRLKCLNLDVVNCSRQADALMQTWQVQARAFVDIDFKPSLNRNGYPCNKGVRLGIFPSTLRRKTGKCKEKNQNVQKNI